MRHAIVLAAHDVVRRVLEERRDVAETRDLGRVDGGDVAVRDQPVGGVAGRRDAVVDAAAALAEERHHLV